MPVAGLTDLPMAPWCQKWTWRCEFLDRFDVDGKGSGWDAYVAAAYADICDADEDIVWVEEFWDGFIF
jgi:hypothetical protein